MSNLILRAGCTPPADIVAQVQKGLFVSAMDHGWYEPDTGLVYLRSESARLIERGRLAAPARPVLLVATPRQLLSGIRSVGNDMVLEEGRGYCQKDGALLPVGVGQPTVLIDPLEVEPLR
jgi:TldD protein